MSTLPTCRKCYKNQVVWADAGVLKSIPYRYCQNCKIEVDWNGFPIPEIKKTRDLSGLEQYLEEQISKMDNDSGTDPFADYEFEVLGDDADDDDSDDFVSRHILDPYKFTP